MDSTDTNNNVFQTVIPIRIADMNYSMYLSNAAAVGILHQARVIFLKANGFDEKNIDGKCISLVSSTYDFKNETCFNNLIVRVAIGRFSNTSFEIIYRALNEENAVEILSGTEKMVFFDYSKKKITTMPESFLTFCKKYQLNST